MHARTAAPTPPSLMPDSRNIQRKMIWERAVAVAVGAWLALALLKFGSPVILNDKTPAPADLMELLIAAWPVEWGIALFVPVLALGVRTARWTWPAPRWLVLLPAGWLGWQILSATQTVDPNLTGPTIAHFGVCVLSFYLGVFALGRALEDSWFWAALLGGFSLVLLVGWHQHVIGLEDTRRFFYEQPNWRDYPPEFLRKIASNRIYATLFYPNALAGVLLLLTPPWLWTAWRLTAPWSPLARWLGISGALILPIGCLVWSGSKAGWLIFVGGALVGLWHARLSRQVKTILTGLVLALALGGFVARYAGYFARGATSVTARGDYWRAAVQLTADRPLLGSGPGTFRIGYKRLKSPDAEMTRLVHNDYLQQAADSGIPGFMLYSAFVLGSVIWLYRRFRSLGGSLSFALWLGLAAFAVQSVVEFGLYIPALAWPFFALLGGLWGAGAGNADPMPAKGTAADRQSRQAAGAPPPSQ